MHSKLNDDQMQVRKRRLHFSSEGSGKSKDESLEASSSFIQKGSSLFDFQCTSTWIKTSILRLSTSFKMKELRKLGKFAFKTPHCKPDTTGKGFCCVSWNYKFLERALFLVVCLSLCQKQFCIKSSLFRENIKHPRRPPIFYLFERGYC